MTIRIVFSPTVGSISTIEKAINSRINMSLYTIPLVMQVP